MQDYIFFRRGHKFRPQDSSLDIKRNYVDMAYHLASPPEILSPSHSYLSTHADSHVRSFQRPSPTLLNIFTSRHSPRT